MIKKLVTSLLTVSAISVVQLSFVAQAAEGNQQATSSKKAVKFICPGSLQDGQKRKTYLAGPKIGKKVQAAFELYSADDIDGALELFEAIVAKEAFDKAYVARLKAVMYVTKGDLEKDAIEQLKLAVGPNLLSEADHASSLKLLADLYMQEEKFAEAVIYYNDWMKFTCKTDPKVWQSVGTAYYQLKQYAKVIEPANNAIKGYGEKHNQTPYILKVRSFYDRKMYQEAIEVLETLVQLFPDSKTWWVQLSNFYLMVEDHAKALATFELAYKQDYLDKESEIKSLSSLYSANGMPYKAAKILEKYMNEGLVKRDDTNLSRLANAWHSALEIDKAAKVYGEVAKITNTYKNYRKQGMLLKQDEQYKSAIAALRKALDLGAEDVGRIHMSIAESYFYLEEYKEAYVAIKIAAEDPKTRKAAKAWKGFIKDTAKRKGKTI
jgi:tetratricopeptide (TPR) repeat protein